MSNEVDEARFLFMSRLSALPIDQCGWKMEESKELYLVV
jgi:hypothetical protein